MTKNCVCCGGNLEEVFNLGIQPLANKYPLEEEFNAEYKQEMQVYLCDKCGYCHVPCSADRSLFFEDYFYLSSVNPELVNHFVNVAKNIADSGAKFVLDVGSNDGILLKPLKDLNIKCVGVDASQNVGDIANSNGLDTFIGFFNEKLALRIKKDKGCPDVIVASSVFTHLSDPGEFFSVCSQLLDKDGFIMIEVEFLNDIIETQGFERFYFDRPHYYTVSSLQRLSAKFGFEIIEVNRIEAHGGSIQVKFMRSIEIIKNQKIVSEEIKPLTRGKILEYFRKFENSCNELKNKLIEFKKNGDQFGGFGCPARLSTITNFANIGPELIPFVVDDTPLKQFRYTPGRHIPIIPFEGSPSVENYLVFAYEYIDSIRLKFSDRGKSFFRPIPFVKI